MIELFAVSVRLFEPNVVSITLALIVESSPTTSSASATIFSVSGSSKRFPVRPFFALVSTVPSKLRVCLPETSTLPPLPLWLPPFASMSP